jgi:hypothetical protein
MCKIIKFCETISAIFSKYESQGYKFLKSDFGNEFYIKENISGFNVKYKDKIINQCESEYYDEKTELFFNLFLDQNKNSKIYGKKNEFDDYIFLCDFIRTVKTISPSFIENLLNSDRFFSGNSYCDDKILDIPTDFKKNLKKILDIKILNLIDEYNYKYNGKNYNYDKIEGIMRVYIGLIKNTTVNIYYFIRKNTIYDGGQIIITQNNDFLYQISCICGHYKIEDTKYGWCHSHGDNEFSEETEIEKIEEQIKGIYYIYVYYRKYYMKKN